ncbi:MAG: PBECR3 domain-containing polyvalent protein [Candidatus Humimicrobiaceae bacterium]
MCNTQKICILNDKIIIQLGIKSISERTIYLFPRVVKHIKDFHPLVFDNYFNKIKSIITKPDYIGKSQSRPDGVELVKIYDDIVMVIICTNKEGLLYVASMYNIDNGKLYNRLRRKRLLRYIP